MKTFSRQQAGVMEKKMVTYPNILTWEILRTEEPGGATVHRVAKSQT